MKDFLKVIAVRDNEVDKYLKDDWEIIETTKEGYGDGGFYLKYHLGLSTKSAMMKYKKIIESYEKHGFKEQLFKKVAESNDEDYSLYTDVGRAGYISKDATIDFIKSYEKDVHDKDVRLFKKGDKGAELYF